MLYGKIFKYPYAAFPLRGLRDEPDLYGISHGQVEIARHVKMFAVQ